MKKKMIIFQLGTNNWQWSDEPAPGSGILHEAHHNAYNALPNVISYSIYPSVSHTSGEIEDNEDDLVRIYKLDKNIPICESAAPNSSRRWHGMNQEEVDDYVNNLESMVYDYLNDIEANHGKGSITFCVAHHTFMNCVILTNVMKKREANKLHAPICGVYVHGTGLKMYVKEIAGKKNKNIASEYPAKFYPMIKNELQIFDQKDVQNKNQYIRFALANSPKILQQFLELFPGFNDDNCLLNYPGYNENIFYKRESDASVSDTLSEMQFKALQVAVAEEKESVVKESAQVIGAAIKYDHLVIFIGKLADWKRMDLVLAASEMYDAHFASNNRNVLTLCIGGGPDKDKVQTINDIKQLKNKNIHWIGPKMQPVLAKVLNVADVGVYPSKNEPFGLVFIETMACGTPVIGAKSGGPIDFITDDVGLLIEEDDKDIMVQNIAKTIIDWIENDVKSAKQKACLECAEKFTVVGQQKKMLKQLTALFDN